MVAIGYSRVKIQKEASIMKKIRNKKRRYLRSRITQRLIVDTAEQVFLEKGYNKTTITEISKQAGVGYGTVYSHFQGKDDLLTKVIDRAMEDFMNILNDPQSIETINDLQKVFEQRIYATLQIAVEQQEIFKVFQKALGQSDLVFDHWNEILNQFITRVENDLYRSREKNIVTSNINLYFSTKALILTLESFLWEIVHEKESDLDTLTLTLTNLFIQGLCSSESLPSLTPK